MKNKFLLLWLVPLVALADSDPDVAAGNAALQNKQPEQALSFYQKAEETLSGNPDLAFNQGGAHYALKKYEESATALLSSTGSKDNIKRAESYRHYGDALFRQDKIDGAIQAYIQALTLNPEDKIAAHNLEVALNKQQPQSQESQESQDPQSQPQSQQSQSQPSSQQSQEQQNQDQNQQNQDQQDQGQQDQQKQEEQSAQNGQENQEKKDGQSGQEQQQKQDEKQGEQGRQAQQSQQEQNPQEPQDKLLDALRAKEKSFLHAKKKGKGTPPTNVNKDW